MKKKAKLAILLLFSLSQINSIEGQELLRISHSCNFVGEESDSEFYVDTPSKEAKTIVEKIMKANILPQNFILKSSNCKNALATTEGGNRYILYNTTFIEKFKKDANSEWAAYSVLAHEIGHHLSNHDLSESNSKKRKVYELQADKFAGGVMFRLKATLEQAQAGINTFVLENETSTHPAKSARLEALASGWVEAKEMNEDVSTSAINNNEKITTKIDSPTVITPANIIDLPNGSKVAYKSIFSEWPTNLTKEGNAKPLNNWNGYEIQAFSNTWVGAGNFINLKNNFNSDFICDIYFKIKDGTPSFNFTISDDGQNYSTIDFYLNFDDYSFSLSESFIKNNFYKSTSKMFTQEREAINVNSIPKLNLNQINKVSFVRINNTVKLYLNNKLLKSFEPYPINFQKISISTAFKSIIELTDFEVKTSK